MQKNEPAFYVILDGVEDPHNLGAVIRTAEATGAHGVITRSRRAVGLTPAAVKAAAGAAEYVPLLQVPNITRTIEVLKKKGVWIVGVDMAGKDIYTGIDYSLPTAIVIGAEGTGISALVRSKCDFLVSIPMRGKITSLNTSVAAAVVLYEALKQRASKR
jgi:23S rRNA (guanosine2251-2'-O)-methyltransferase